MSESLKEQLEEVLDRWTVRDDGSRAELYGNEAQRIQRWDRLSWLLILSGVVPLAYQNFILLPLWIAGGLAVFFAFRRGTELSKKQADRGVVLAAFAGALYGFGTSELMWGFTILIAGIMLVLMLKSGMKNEVQYIYLLAFVLFIVFAHLTLEYTFLLGLAAITISGLLVMLRYNFPDQVAPGQYVMVITRLARPLALAVAVAAPIFVVMPRVPVSTLTVKKAPSTPGLAEEIEFGDMGPTLSSGRLFMTVRAKEGRRWRGIVLDTYTGRGWKRLARLPASRTAPIGQRILLNEKMTPEKAGDMLEQEFILEPTACEYFLAAQFPVAIETDFGEVRVDTGYTVSRPYPSEAKRIRYVVWSSPDVPHEAIAQIKSHYLRLPDSLPQRVRAEAKRLTQGAATDAQRAAMIENHLVDNFTYTLDTRTPEGRDAVDYFLFDEKEGHCEYFAAAMAVMLRSLGIPSRVVTGFNQGTYDAVAGTYSVLELNAHAWVEAFVEGENGEKRWIEYDPTTGNGRPEEAQSLAARLGLDQIELYKKLAGTLNWLDFEWQRYVVSFSTSMQWEVIQKLSRAYDSFEIALRVWWKTRRRGQVLFHPATLAGFVILVIVFRRPLGRLLRWIRARGGRVLDRGRSFLEDWLATWRRSGPPPEERFYRDLLGVLKRRGIQKPAWETPLELATRLAASHPALHEPVMNITDILYQVKYRGRSLDAAMKKVLQEALDRIALAP